MPLNHGAQEVSPEKEPGKVMARPLLEQGGVQSRQLHQGRDSGGRRDGTIEFPPRTKQRRDSSEKICLNYRRRTQVERTFRGHGSRGGGVWPLITRLTQALLHPSCPPASTFRPHPLTRLLPLGCSEANRRYGFIFQFVSLRDYFPERDYRALSTLVPSLVPVSWTVGLMRARAWPACCNSFTCLSDLSVLRSSLAVV